MLNNLRNSHIWILSFLFVTLVLIFVVLLNQVDPVFYSETIGTKGTANSVADKKYQMSLFMVGDALIHSSVYNDAYQDGKYDFSKMIAKVAPAATKADLAFYNQETILGGTEIGLSTYPRFNSPYEVGDAFIGAGFNLVSLANNHTLDRGETAIVNSLDYWENKDVITAGSYRDFDNYPQVYEKNNITYAFLAYTDLTNGLSVPKGKEYYLTTYNETRVKNDIAKIRDKVDVVMVSMHFGSEYVHKPTSRQVEIATFLANNGVDLVIGHHPHVVQPVEYIGDTLVIYSLGNFISAQIEENKRVGLAVSLNINKEVKLGQTTISFDNVKADLHYTYYKNFKNYDVIPFGQLDNSKLSNYEQVYQKYINIIKNDNVTIGDIF